MICPKCSTPCHRDEVDVGVGIISGPYGCPGCGWSEDFEYDAGGKAHDRVAMNSGKALGGADRHALSEGGYDCDLLIAG